MIEHPILEAFRTAIATSAAAAADRDAAHRLVAVGWATVESDRAIAELADALGVDASAFAPAAGSALLGSSAFVATRVLDGIVDVAVVEPLTEGRLAAHLARHGEGPTIAWLADDDIRGQAVGLDGPFGPERLLARQPDGLLRLLVATPPGTIRR